MNNDLQKKLGKKIKLLRLNLGLSQEKLAEHLDIAINTLSNIERGNAFMTSATLEKISNLFNVSYDELFNFDYNEETSDFLYDKIVSRLNLVKDNYEKLKQIDTITKVLIS